MKAAVLTDYNVVEWKDMEMPSCGPGEVLIKVAFATICGTDQHIFKGEFHPRTRTPMIMGHEFAGEIIQKGEEVKGFEIGERVAPDPIIWCGKCPACTRGHYPACTNLKLIGIDMDGGFVQYINLPASMLYSVPPTVPLEYAALVEILSIGFHAKNQADVNSGDVIVIWGSGKVGLSILQAVRTVTDQTVFMVDILDERLSIGPGYYENIIPINAAKEDPVVRISHETGGKGVDIAFEAVGHARHIDNVVNPVRGSIQSIRGGGKVCVLGLGGEPSPVIFRELIWKEGSIVSSRVSHGEFSETIENLRKGSLKPEALISKVLPASETQDAFQILDDHPGENIKILLDFS